ncbi:MAG: nuclease-related domain-containing protein [Planctomycetota bacterium]
MITLPWSEPPATNNPRKRAGTYAERQLAFYLRRRFADDPRVCVLNGLRIEEPRLPTVNGQPDRAQIDHLILHRYGAFIVESKSVSEEVWVRDDGTGGDEWWITYQGQAKGIQSPMQQAHRQAEFLRSYLKANASGLLKRLPTLLRPIAKLLQNASGRRTFTHMPIQVIVAISDSGRIRREGRWTEPNKPFRSFVCKADQVEHKVEMEIKRHAPAGQWVNSPFSNYGLWSMTQPEVAAVAGFLAERHSPSQHVARVQVKTQSCPRCQSPGARLLSGKRGMSDYWRCDACGKNTPHETAKPA